MVKSNNYLDLKNRSYSLAELTTDEKQLISECKKFAEAKPDWGDYTNHWIPKAEALLSKYGLDRPQMIRSTLWRIVQDIGARLHIESGLARSPDYRDELEQIIRERFSTRRAFCEATGLSEDMLSHVLARRKHLAIDTLADALGRIGYALRILPAPNMPEST
jgi:hypothetical protein